MSTTWRICLIDDNALVRDALALGLRDAGHEVIVADDGAAGLAAAEAARPDVVIADLALPDMENGELVGALRARWRDLPIVAVSGSGGDGEAVAAEMGADVFLGKPFKVKALNAAMAEAMALRGRG